MGEEQFSKRTTYF